MATVIEGSSDSIVASERHKAYLGFGSNVGEREQHLSRGAELLASCPDIFLKRSSQVYETIPEGGPAQGRYLNLVWEVETTLAPRDLLRVVQNIERLCGRTREREERWGPRTLDIDILLYDVLVFRDAALVIPHPRLQERRFVLEPLRELEPELMHPVLGVTVSDLLRRLTASPVAV